MADTQVPDNHDKAHEVMTEQDAIERGQQLAEQNSKQDQELNTALQDDAARGVLPQEGNVPENNEDNGQDTGPNRGDLSNTRPSSSTTASKGVKSSK